MNAVLETIRKRRSVRSYERKPIPRDVLQTIIEAGNQAPSAMNSQPWRFVAVEDRDLRLKLLQAALPNAKKMLDQVKATDPDRFELIMKRYAELEDPIYYAPAAVLFVIGSGRYADLSCPLACQNIMLAAHSLGIGSCWVAFGSMVTDDPEIVRALELKKEEKIFGPIVLGYPKDYPDPPEKREPVITFL